MTELILAAQMEDLQTVASASGFTVQRVGSVLRFAAQTDIGLMTSEYQITGETAGDVLQEVGLAIKRCNALCVNRLLQMGRYA